ncbi:MAG: hypothetical protein JWM20_869 [Patescibacteria group bacterium]|nr:hypothetical protein [Patescibacteria group bacterium]
MKLFNSDYNKGYRAAKSYVRIISLPKDVTNNIKSFLDSVYVSAVSGLAHILQENLSYAENRIRTIEVELKSLKDRKEKLITEANQIDEKEVTELFLGQASEIEARIQEFNRNIELLNDQLNELKKEHIQVSSKEKPVEKTNSKSASFIGSVIQKLQESAKEFSTIGPWFLLVLVDYGIAVSFFSQYAEGQGFLVEVVVGYLLPLAITLISMVAMHMVIDGVKKLQSDDAAPSTAISTVAAVVILALIFFGILFMRVLNDGDNLVMQIVIWVLFVGLVIVVGYELHKKGKSPGVIIEYPAKMIVCTLGLICGAIAWPFEQIHNVTTKQRNIGPEAELKKSMVYIQERINNQFAEKARLEGKLTNLPREKMQFTSTNIAILRQQKMNMAEKDIQEIDAIIYDNQAELVKSKAAEKSLKDRLMEIRTGSNDGAMKQLMKRLRQKS